MRGEPVLVFLVGAQVVQDDVDLPVSGSVGNDLVHEGLKVGPLLGLGGLAADDARGNLQRGEQVDRAVALVGALPALDDLAAAGLHVASRALQRLDRRLLVNAEQIGRASCRDRVCQYVYISVVAVSIKIKIKKTSNR